MNSNHSEIMDCLLSLQSSHDPVEEAIEATEEPSFDANLLNDVKDILDAVVSKTATSPVANCKVSESDQNLRSSNQRPESSCSGNSEYLDADSDFAANDGLSEQNEADLTLLLLDKTAENTADIVDSVFDCETLTTDTVSNSTSVHSTTNEPLLEQKMEENDVNDEIPLPRGQYKFDFNDPNVDFSTLNPFGGKVQMANSPAVAASKASAVKKSPKTNVDSQVAPRSPAAKTPEHLTTANESPNSVANASPKTVYNTPPESQSLLNTPSSGGTPNRSADQFSNDVQQTPTAIHNNLSNQEGTTVKKQPVRKIFDESEQISQTPTLNKPMVNGNRTPPPEQADDHPVTVPDGFKQKKTMAAVQPITQQQFDEEQFQMGSEAMFDDERAWEQLMNQGSHANVESDLARQSIFVKFDPLMGGVGPQQRICNGPTINPNMVSSTLDDTIMQEEAVTADDEDNLMLMKTPSPSVARSAAAAGNSASPMAGGTMVKKPRPTANINQNEPGADVDRLLAVSPQQQQQQIQASPGDASADSIIRRMKLEHQAELVRREKEWSQMAADKDKQLHNMRSENEQLKQQLQFTANMVKELEAAVISGSSDAGASGQLSSVPDVEDIQRQRDQAMDDFRGVETSFADLHRRYEKLRLQVEEQKQSEGDYDQRHKSDVEKLRKAEDRLKKLKEDAEQKLDAANSEIERLKNLRETDTIGLRAQLKRAEVQMESFERAIEQKNKEIVELTNICDELIAKTSK